MVSRLSVPQLYRQIVLITHVILQNLMYEHFRQQNAEKMENTMENQRQYQEENADRLVDALKENSFE